MERYRELTERAERLVKWLSKPPHISVSSPALTRTVRGISPAVRGGVNGGLHIDSQDLISAEALA